MALVSPRPLPDVLRPDRLPGDGPLVERIHALLHRLILDLDLPPWQTLSEKEVAACLEVSKTPVREALIRLARDGLVEVVPKSRTFVRPIHLDRLREGAFVRLHLETGAAARAAEERSLEDVCALKACLARQDTALEARDYDAFRQLDEEFHALIFEAARLPGVRRVVRTASLEVDRVRSLKQRLGVRRTGTVLADHRAIADAIAERRPEGAAQGMQAHLGPVEDKVWELGENPELWALFEAVNRAKARPRLSA